MSARKGRTVARTSDPTRTAQAKAATLARKAERTAKQGALLSQGESELRAHAGRVYVTSEF